MLRESKNLSLFLTFLKTGAFTFGGGYAMITLLEHEFVTKKKWLTKEEFLDMVSIAESTPGPVAVNSATYVGYHIAGLWGALLSTIAVCFPSFVIIYAISTFFDHFLEFIYVQYALKGIQACVVYLILSAAIQMLKGIRNNIFHIIILVVISLSMVCCSVNSIHFSSVFCLIVCGLAGVFGYLIRQIRLGKRNEVTK